MRCATQLLPALPGQRSACRCTMHPTPAEDQQRQASLGSRASTQCLPPTMNGALRFIPPPMTTSPSYDHYRRRHRRQYALLYFVNTIAYLEQRWDWHREKWLLPAATWTRTRLHRSPPDCAAPRQGSEGSHVHPGSGVTRRRCEWLDHRGE